MTPPEVTPLGVTASAAHGNGLRRSKKTQSAALLLPPASFCLNLVLERKLTSAPKTSVLSTPPLVNDKPLGWEDSLLVIGVSFGC